jgi:hypothetical protein
MKRLNDDDLDFIRWRIWEPLRRNLEYQSGFNKLFKPHINAEGCKEYPLDLEAQSNFCSKWRLPYAVDPSLSFDQLFSINAKDTKQQKARRIQNLFSDRYHPPADSAAFVNLLDCIHGKYLQLYVDLGKSRNQIEAEFKKVLDEWLSKDRLEYHGIGQEKSARLHGETWESRFQVFDLAERCTPFPQIKRLLKIPIDTVYKQYKAAWESVNPGQEYPTRRKREKSLDSDALKSRFPCTSCLTRECEKTNRPTCKRVEAFQKKYTEYSQIDLLIEDTNKFSA